MTTFVLVMSVMGNIVLAIALAACLRQVHWLRLIIDFQRKNDI